MSDDSPSTDFESIRRIREAAAMGTNQNNGGACSVNNGSTCTFLAASENLMMTLKELSRGQKDLGEKMAEHGETLHKIEIRLERGDAALANAKDLVKDVEDLKMWKAKAEGSAFMLKWLIGLAVGGGAAGVISAIVFVAKLAGKG